MSDQSTTTSPPSSPLDKARALIVGRAIKVWDVEEEDPAMRYQKLFFLRNLVLSTPPKSKLAYQICHYMEQNYLDIEGLELEFPSSRVKHKAEQKGKNEKRRKIEADIKLALAEEKQLLGGGSIIKSDLFTPL